MLTLEEKETLYLVIAGTFGEDITIKNRVTSFNDETVKVVEKMLTENKKCNKNMAELVADLVSKTGSLRKGWLKKILKNSKDVIANIEINGYSCLVTVKSKWKADILTSTI